jgi:RNA polymerase sigma-70 factor (ECF subfamily)
MLDIVSWLPAVVRRRQPGPSIPGIVLVPRLFIHPLLAALVKRPSEPEPRQDSSTASISLAEPADPGARVDDLYVRYARPLLTYLYHRLPSLADAEDILAEVFLTALRASTRGETLGAGWLMVVARRRVADFYHERHRKPFTQDQLHVEELLQDPEWMALRAEERIELLALVAQLPIEQRDVLSLRFAGGLRSAQIALLIGKTDEATRALLSRAVRRLRKEWRG